VPADNDTAFQGSLVLLVSVGRSTAPRPAPPDGYVAR
jgi:hypothetical protein